MPISINTPLSKPTPAFKHVACDNSISFACVLELPYHFAYINLASLPAQLHPSNKMGASLLTCILFSCSFLALLRSYDASHEDEPPVYVAPQAGLKEADRIPALVDQPKGIAFSQYAGYVTVDPMHGRALFYYFVESPTEPTKKPLVLWLSGGPGCSSLGYGAMSQLGPFRVNRNRKLYENDYALNKVANVIFLESPAGVGFSYSNTSSDYELSGDERTAQDSHTFLVNWLERYPEYKNRDFYMAGSSYSGHYIPQLAQLILLKNNKTDKPINLKGLAIGNAYLGTNLNFIMDRYKFLWSHAMYSDETHTMLLKTCNKVSLNFSECLRVQSQADREIGGIDLYNIYATSCQSNRSSGTNVEPKPLEYDPCSDGYVLDYLNNPSVQKTLHAVPTNWTFCGTLNYWTDLELTMVHTMKKLIASRLRVWLYSGDLDSVCSVPSTKSFIKLLKLPIESPWRPWYNIGEVGGYVVAYKGLTFVTVRGAGHEVPSFEPERGLHVLSSFLQGKLP